MKNLLLVLLFIFSMCLAYTIGERKGLDIYEHSVREGLAERYIKIIGNPSTQEQQCKFDYIIYNDSTECK